MRAISVLSLDAGTSTFGCRAAMALRTRVSISAMGSVTGSSTPSCLWACRLPARLHHAGNLAVQRELTEAEPANPVLAEERARTSAAPAAVAMAAGHLRLSLLLVRQLVGGGDFFVFCDLGGCGHSNLFSCCCGLLCTERHAHLFEQREPLGIRPGRGGDGNVHPLGLFDLRVVDLRKNQLIFHA